MFNIEEKKERIKDKRPLTFLLKGRILHSGRLPETASLKVDDVSPLYIKTYSL